MHGVHMINFNAIPTSVKSGLILLLLGWIWFLFSVYYYYDKSFWERFLIGGVIVIICVLQFKKWTYVLALLCNAMTILYCGFFTLVFHLSGADPQIVTVSAINVLLFGFSSYFLLQKNAVSFFRSNETSKSDQS